MKIYRPTRLEDVHEEVEEENESRGESESDDYEEMTPEQKRRKAQNRAA